MPSVGSTPTSSPASFQQTSQTSNSTAYGSSTSSSPNQNQITSNTGNNFTLSPAIFASLTTNKTNRTKYSQFMIITPAVSIDRNFDNHTTGAVENDEINETNRYNNYKNLNLLNNNHCGKNNFTTTNRSSKVHSRNRNHLLSNTPNGFYTSSSWRWCTLLCAAMRCFGGGRSTNAPYTTSFSRTRAYTQDMPVINSNENYNTQLFTTPRRTRDHLNNITYEL